MHCDSERRVLDALQRLGQVDSRGGPLLEKVLVAAREDPYTRERQAEVQLWRASRATTGQQAWLAEVLEAVRSTDSECTVALEEAIEARLEVALALLSRDEPSLLEVLDR